MRKLFQDEVGFVVSAELVLVLTIGVLAMVVGLASVRDAVSTELGDLSSAFGAISQTYNVTGVSKPKTSGTGAHHPNHASILGFGFTDAEDNCDCREVTLDEVCGKTQTGTAE